MKVLELTRIYETIAPENQSPDENVFIPDASVNLEKENKTECVTEDETNQLQEEQVATLSDAIVSVAGISQDKADIAESKWKSVNAGTPVYAEIIKDSPDLIIMVTSQEGTNYYVYFSSDGNFKEIHVGTEDGPVINTTPCLDQEH